MGKKEDRNPMHSLHSCMTSPVRYSCMGLERFRTPIFVKSDEFHQNQGKLMMNS